jgi:ribonucleoside-diphosphate reductase alpha chain
VEPKTADVFSKNGVMPELLELCSRMDWEGIAKTTRTAIRMLDNVIDINFYTTVEAKNANTRHRPIGLGVMGLQTLLQKLNLPIETELTTEFNDWLFEFINWNALDESANLAKEKGEYSTFQGSDWSKGIMPIDNFKKSIVDRGIPTTTPLDNPRMMDWSVLASKIKLQGLRNSQVMAIAPTRTISYIAGVSPSIEPWDSNVFSEVGMTGKYTMINEELIAKLEENGLWIPEIVAKIKIANGSIQKIKEIPDAIKAMFKTAWEIHPKYLIGQNARRQKWIDMGISFNQWISSTNGKDAEMMYLECWKAGLKTTYYLHSKSASQAARIGIETDINLNTGTVESKILADGTVCDMTDPECEACQ